VGGGGVQYVPGSYGALLHRGGYGWLPTYHPTYLPTIPPIIIGLIRSAYTRWGETGDAPYSTLALSWFPSSMAWFFISFHHLKKPGRKPVLKTGFNQF